MPFRSCDGTVMRVEFAFAPDDLGFIADPYPVYSDARAGAHLVPRADRSLAGVAVRRRQRIAPRSAVRPHVSSRRDAHRDGPSGRARMAWAVLAPDPQRHPRHGATRSHARASARLEGLHAPDGGRDARSDPGDDGRAGRRHRRRGGVRPDLDARRAAARGRDRRAARHTARGPRPVASVVRRHLRHVRAASVRGDGSDGGASMRRVLRLPPDPFAGTPRRPARRPHQRARRRSWTKGND